MPPLSFFRGYRLFNSKLSHSLRAQFGSDIKANAVHGSSTADNAKEIITGIFGVVEFDKTGNIDMGETAILGYCIRICTCVSCRTARRRRWCVVETCD